jgi:hypothetical protein
MSGGGGTAPTYFPDERNGVATAVTSLLKRRCNRRNAVTRADRGGERVGDEEAELACARRSWSVLGS